jgi:hypothetical protein
MTEPTLEDIVRKLDAIAPHIAGIPLLQNSIEVLQRDIRILRDELRVNTAMVQRAANAADDQARTLNAIHQWMTGMNTRMHKLEGAVDHLSPPMT